MSTIPGGCFVAPDSLRRLNQLQKQHAREAKLQQATQAQPKPESAPIPILVSPPVDHTKSSSFTNLKTIPQRLSEILTRTRSMSSPQSTPPATPPLSPQLPQFPSQETMAINIPKAREDMRNRDSIAGSV